VAIKNFEKHIRNLRQMEVLTGAVSSLNKLLVDKRLVSEDDLQTYFMNWLRTRNRTRRKQRSSKGRQRAR
jgi:hypothetical protein